MDLWNATSFVHAAFSSPLHNRGECQCLRSPGTCHISGFPMIKLDLVSNVILYIGLPILMGFANTKTKFLNLNKKKTAFGVSIRGIFCLYVMHNDGGHFGIPKSRQNPICTHDIFLHDDRICISRPRN